MAASWKTSAVAIGLIVAVASGVVWAIFNSQPTAQRETATKKTAMLVETVSVERGDFRPTVVATGTVRAQKEVQLSPQVGGRVVTRAEEFTPGGFVAAGQVLVGLEQREFRNAVQQRKADLSQAQAQLRIEMGRQDVAQEEYEQLFRSELDQENEELFLREPQLAAARTAVLAAEAALDQAELQLERTVISAPFEAHVLSRNVEVGSRITPSTVLGRLVATDGYWVVTDVPLAQRALLDLESGPESQPDAWIRSRSWPPGVRRRGDVERQVGALDERSRMARILVKVEDPLSRDQSSNRPSLIIGEFVEVGLKGRVLEDVVRIPHDLLRDGDTVWLMEQGKLHIQPVQVRAQDERFAYVSSGLGAEDRLVATSLATVAEGAPLKQVQPEASGSAESNP